MKLALAAVVYELLWPTAEAGATLDDIPNDDDWNTPERMKANRERKAGEMVRDWLEELFDWSQYDEGESPTRGYGQRYCMPSTLLGMRDDIGSLWRVNWDEIGASFLADAAEQLDTPNA